MTKPIANLIAPPAPGPEGYTQTEPGARQIERAEKRAQRFYNQYIAAKTLAESLTVQWDEIRNQNMRAAAAYWRSKSGTINV